MSGFSLSGYKATIVNNEIGKIDVRLTITSAYGGNYDKPFRFKTHDAEQTLTISIRSPQTGPGGKPRFYMCNILIKQEDVDEHVTSLEYIHPTTGAGITRYGPDVLDTLPEHTKSVTLHLKMKPGTAFYLSVVAVDRNTGAEVNCDPQASNDPETKLASEISSMLSAFENHVEISMDSTSESDPIEIEG